jgi:probable rRNA maturation factor
LVIFQKKVAGLSAKSLNHFALRARRAARMAGTIDVLITSSSAMRTLNLRFREKNRATDVLSFPAGSSPHGKRRPRVAGEIAISAEIAMDNARRLGHSAAIEVKILVLHGILHLAGFDHERDNGQMARKEARLRKVLRLPSSLTERGQSSPETAISRQHRSTGSRRTPKTA